MEPQGQGVKSAPTALDRRPGFAPWEPKSLVLQGSLLVLQTGQLNVRATSFTITDTYSVASDLKRTL